LSNRNILSENQAIFTNVFMCKCVKKHRRSGRWKKIYLYILVFICRLDYLRKSKERGKNFRNYKR